MAKPGRKPLPKAERARRHRASTRKAALKWYRKNRAAVNPRRCERRFRDREREKSLTRRRVRQLAAQGLYVVTSGQLRCPLLKRWDGKVLTAEDNRTAEEVIQEWLKSQKSPLALS
jgi:hypothetical protein